MAWVTFAAIGFVVWWVVVFAMLPLGLRTQDDESDVTLGTVASAPRGPHMARVVLRTTLVTAAVMALYYVASTRWGIGLDSLPQLVPTFEG